MRTHLRTRVLAGLAASATVAAVLAAPASAQGRPAAQPRPAVAAATAAVPSLPTQQVEGRNFTRRSGGLVATNAFAATPTAISNSSNDSPACGEDWTNFLAVVEGTLTDYTIDWGPATCGNGEPVVKSTRYNAGWGQMRQLVLAGGYLFALHQNGNLYRYTITNGKPTRSAGYVAGFGTVRSMALVHSDSRKVVLLMNLSGGSLYQATFPAGSTFKSVVAPVRTSTWGGLEQLVTVPNPDGSIELQGIDTNTASAFRYDLGPLRGTATVMRGLGRTEGTWTSAQVQGVQVDFPYRGAP